MKKKLEVWFIEDDEEMYQSYLETIKSPEYDSFRSRIDLSYFLALDNYLLQKDGSPDIIILDLGALPRVGMNGCLRLIRKFVENHKSSEFMFVSAVFYAAKDVVKDIKKQFENEIFCYCGIGTPEEIITFCKDRLDIYDGKRKRMR